MNAFNTDTAMFKANKEWASRPADQRFTSLIDMNQHFRQLRENSKALVVSSRRLEAAPDSEGRDAGLVVMGELDGKGFESNPTHWSFGQLAQLAGAPAGYLRQLPAAIAADCVNYGLKHTRDIEDVGVLLTRMPTPVEELAADGSVPAMTTRMRAATGPRYGRIWNYDLTAELVTRFGDGVSGEWKVPGEFGKDVAITKANTTLFGSDRDMFVFLCDEKNRIEVPNRRNGQAGSLARGFFVWNSEVGSATLGIGFFLFDYVCCNRIVWGMEGYKEVTIRHTASAPDKWLADVTPTLVEYSKSSAVTVEQAIANAQAKKLDDVDQFLTKRFGARQATALKLRHEAEEGRPIESIWDVTVASTALARDIEHQDRRVEVERAAGDLLREAAE